MSPLVLIKLIMSKQIQKVGLKKKTPMIWDKKDRVTKLKETRDTSTSWEM